MENQKSTLGDLISAESRNILEKYNRLYKIIEKIGIKEDKWDDLFYLQKELPNINHKHKEEAINLVIKLLKIK
jgi:hypothetical protein|tara:strand:+ start:1841 stop:2059 length:219 start_codon:yes stop_codon:yes gene_type:complete